MSSVDRLARRLDRVERDIRNTATQPRLANSSIDGGALQIRDVVTGEVTAIVGQQFDGTSTVAPVGGTFPVAPTMPLVTEIVGGLRIYWDGTYVDGSPTRMDFRRVTLHAVLDVDDFDALDPGQIVGEITIATGGEITVGLPYVEHYVCAVVWTEAGKFSVESDFAFGTPQFVSSADLDPSISFEGTDGVAPSSAPVVTGEPGFKSAFLTWPEVTNPDPVWYEIAISDTPGFTPVAGDVVGNTPATMAHFVTALETAYIQVRALDGDGAGPWSTEISVVPIEGLDTAALDAAIAGVNATLATVQTDLDAAEADIVAANADIAAVNVTLGTVQGDLDTVEANLATVQTDLNTAEGTLATVQTDLNTAETTLGTVQTDLDAAEATLAIHAADIIDAAADAAAAQTAATTAQTTADGKNKVTYSTAAPGTTANTAGDLWFRRDATTGRIIALYEGTGGTSWTQRTIDGVTLAAIDAGTITVGTLSASRIGADTITSTHIAADAITTSELAANAVITENLNAGAVTAAKIAALTITAAEIAANTITAAKIVALTITGNEIAANTITGGKLVANTITAAQIAANTITAAQIATDAVTADEIAANTITAAEIAALTITGAQIAANTITASKIVANTITANEIASNAVTADEIAANTITAAEIAAGTITATEIASDYIYAGAISANQIQTGDLEATVAVVGELKTAGAGRNVSISSSEGFKAIDPDGGVVAHIPTDLSQDISLQGDVIAKSITALGPIAMRHANNEIAQAAVLNLRTGTTSPATPPQASIVWSGLGRANSPIDSWFRGGNYQAASNRFVQAWTFFGLSGVHIMDANGVVVDQIDIGDGSNGLDTYSAFRAGTTIYAHVRNGSTGNWEVRRYDATSKALLGTWALGSDVSFAEGPPTTTVNTAGSLILVFSLSGVVRVHAYNRDTGASVSETVTPISMPGGEIVSAHWGPADVGSDRLWFTSNALSAPFCWNPSGNVRDANNEFPNAYGDPISMLTYDTTRGCFIGSSRSTGEWYLYDGTMWTTESSSWFVTATWKDTDATGGTHETMQGPPVSVTMKKRARLSVTSPPIPTDPNNANHDDPNAVRFYVGRTAGAARSTQFLNASPADGVRTATVVKAIFSNADTLHPNPPAAGDFPNLTPGLVKSDQADVDGSMVSISGDGAVRMGDFKVVSGRASIALPHFHGRLAATNYAITVGTFLPYEVVESVGGGTWTVGNLRWTAPVSGIYRVTFQFKNNGTAASPKHEIRQGASTVLWRAPDPPSASFGGYCYSWEGRLTAGQDIGVFLASGAYTTQSDGATVDNNYLTISYVRP